MKELADSAGSMASSTLKGRQTSQAHKSVSPDWQNTCTNHRTNYGCCLLPSCRYQQVALAHGVGWQSLLRSVGRQSLLRLSRPHVWTGSPDCPRTTTL